MLSQGMFPNRAPAAHVSDVLAAFIDYAAQAELPPASDAVERARLTLMRHRDPKWKTLAGGGQLSLVYVPENESITYSVSLPAWTALMVDGEFERWLRGDQRQPLKGLSPGLHHVVLVRP